jgi:hypothetical protein
MNANDVLKTYAIFYVSENDEFDVAKKLDMLNFIEHADESMLMDLFENNEIESPFNLLESDPQPEKSTETLIGEADIMTIQIEHLFEGDEFLLEDMKNKLKDMLGMETDLKYKIGKATGSAKKALEKQLSSVTDKIGDLRDAVSKGAGKAVKAGGEALEKGKEMVGDAGKAVKAVTDDAGKAIEKGVKVAHKAAGAAADTAKDVATQAGQKVATGVGKAAEFAQSQPGVVGAAVAVAAAMTAGVMAYRKFFSKAAQACKSAPDKSACLSQYKMKAKQAQIATLNAGKAKCAKSKNAAGCKAKIDNKIKTLQAKMRG